MPCNNDKDSFQRVMGYNSFGERSLGTSSSGLRQTAATFSSICEDFSYLESKNMSSKGDSELDKSGQRYIFCFLTNFNVLSRKIYIYRGLKWAPLTR